jgi:hypothetical protein
MQRKQLAVVTGIVLALLSAATGVVGWAAGDTPIVILDGSLTVQSAVHWKEFKGDGDKRSHPKADGSISKVVVTIGGKDQTIVCNKMPCAVNVTYAGTNIEVASGGPDAKGLTFSPFSAFQDGPTPDVLVHKNQNAKISHVTVSMSGVKLIDSAASGGGTKVVISYE